MNVLVLCLTCHYALALKFAMIFLIQDFRNGVASCQEVLLLLKHVDDMALQEFTSGGQPAVVNPVHMVCSGRDKEDERCEFLREMLRLSASANVKSQRTGCSPLHRAAGTGALMLVQTLLDMKAHVNAVNNSGATPMDTASNSSTEAYRDIHYF